MRFDKEAHHAQDVALVADRIGLGDLTDVAREVDHAGLFRSKDSARAAAIELEGLGLKVDKVGRHWSHPSWVMVQFRSNQQTDLATVRWSTNKLVQVCERHGGVYDGWGAMVVTDRP
jgi:hypothetical protein